MVFAWFPGAVELRRNKTCLARCNRDPGPIRGGAAAGNAHIRNDQGLVAGIFKVKGMLHHVTFPDGAEIELCFGKGKQRAIGDQLLLRQRAYRLRRGGRKKQEQTKSEE